MYQLLFYSDDPASVAEMQFLGEAVEVSDRIRRTFDQNMDFQRVVVMFRSDHLYSLHRDGRRSGPAEERSQAAA